eukprot:m.7445 g.7445  ORF g.7445 m.7445 type:complete len:419 (+) comp3962_c0_seq1:229-1485(+)
MRGVLGLWAAAALGGIGTGTKTPVILIPGFPTIEVDFLVPSDCQLPSTLPPMCQPARDVWAPLWLPQPTPVGVEVTCWIQYMGVVFNTSSPTQFSPSVPCLQTRVRDFGGFGAMPKLNKTVLPAFEAAGYVVGKTLFGAPYDWRLPPSAQPEFVADFKSLVENVSAANGGRKVALVSVSYGPGYALGFLHRMPQSWKDDHIAWFVAESPGWSGFLGPILVYISGYLEDGSNATSFATQVARSVAQETASVPWTFPLLGNDPNTSWPSTEVLFSTEKRNYTARDYESLVTDLGGGPNQLATARAMAADPDLHEFAPPGVDTFVACGIGLSTPVGASYRTGFGVNDDWVLHEVRMGAGDGVMPSRTCGRGAAWAGAGHKYTMKVYQGMSHASCIHPNSTDPFAPNSICFRDVLQLLNAKA